MVWRLLCLQRFVLSPYSSLIQSINLSCKMPSSRCCCELGFSRLGWLVQLPALLRSLVVENKPLACLHHLEDHGRDIGPDYEASEGGTSYSFLPPHTMAMLMTERRTEATMAQRDRLPSQLPSESYVHIEVCHHDLGASLTAPEAYKCGAGPTKSLLHVVEMAQTR
ncbi:hypothetical protein BDV06DRAFT_85193 [Aspergillus oleicola]